MRPLRYSINVTLDGCCDHREMLADDTVAGNVVYWEAAGEPNIGYWLGKTHWGKGIASAALAQFLTKIEARPVYAHVAKHNFASIRVLQKCGFQLAREDMCDGDDGEELVMELRSDRSFTCNRRQRLPQS